MKYTVILGLFAILLLAGCQEGMNAQTQSDMNWRCSAVVCAETVQLTGEQWAAQNCRITEQGTLCTVTLQDGTQNVVPVESINLTAVQAQQCVRFECVEETPYKKVNYTYNVTAAQ